MLKKSLYFSSIILLGFLVFYLYFKIDHKPAKSIDREIFKAVPRNAGIVIYSNNPIEFAHKLQNENLVWQLLRQMPILEKTAVAMAQMDSMLTNESIAKLDLRKASLAMSLHALSSQKYIPLLVVEMEDGIQNSTVSEMMKALYGEGMKTSGKPYNDVVLMSITDSLDNLKASYFVTENLLVWSTSDLLAEKSAGEISASLGLEADHEFLRLRSTAGKNVDANVFINFDELGGIIKPWLNKTSLAENIKTVGSWAALDLHSSGQAVLLDGFIGHESPDNFLMRFKDQEPVALNASNIIPQNMRYVISMAINDLDRYFLYYPTSVDDKKDLDQWKDEWLKEYGSSAESMLRNLYGGEIAIVSNLDKIDEKKYLIVQLAGSTNAQEYFDDFLQILAKKTNSSKNDFTGIIKIDDATEYPYYTFPVNTLFSKYFGSLFETTSFNYFVFYDNYMIVAKSQSHLKAFLYSNLLGQTMAESVDYEDFTKSQSTKANFQLYMDFKNIDLVAEKLFTSDFVKNQIGITDRLKKLNALGFQLISSSNDTYSNFYLDYGGVRKEETQTIWQSLLDSAVGLKPTLVKNHYTKENEICVQDKKNVLYLISPSGRIIWKKALSEPILGQVYQIDKYKNGKLQILFTTASQIHLLDRNGNYVSRYPINLASKAIGGLGLVDYDNKRDYRIFVPCDNKTVVLYDKDGNSLDGWKFKRADYAVNSDVWHFKVDTKDFIVFTDKNRLYFLDRQGQVRLRLKKQFSKAINSDIYFDRDGLNGKPCFITSDVDGNVRYIAMNGAVLEKKLEIADANHAFRYEDLDGDRREELIFLEDKLLSVFNHNGTKLFEYKFVNSITYPPYIYEFSNRDKRIGIVDGRAGQLYLFESGGQISKGFPLAGSTPFTLGFLKNDASSFNLLVGGSDNYLYNYRVK